MPRKPYNVTKARRLLREWIALRISKAPTDAPITVDAALAHLAANDCEAHRATLYKHGLQKLVQDGARQQREEGGGRQVESERRQYEAQLATMREEAVVLERRNRALLGEIATLLWNARRLGLREEEMRREMPKPDRSSSKAGRRA